MSQSYKGVLVLYVLCVLCMTLLWDTIFSVVVNDFEVVDSTVVTRVKPECMLEVCFCFIQPSHLNVQGPCDIRSNG